MKYAIEGEASSARPVGCRSILADSIDMFAIPTDRAPYSRLCRLRSLGKARACKAQCELYWADLEVSSFFILPFSSRST